MTKNRIDYPAGALSAYDSGGHSWMFEYPRLDMAVYDRYEEAIDTWEIGEVDLAEQALRDLIADYPEFIDVYHHLAMLLEASGREEEAFQMWQQVVQMGLECVGEGFEPGRDRLEWGYLDNRPFLRAYHGLGLAYLERGDRQKAFEIFRNILAMNPNDNQGIRGILADMALDLGKPEEVLALCDRYPNDAMEQLVYGRPLALLMLGREQEAKAALQEAVDLFPLIGEELIKETHEVPAGWSPEYVTMGGEDQAYDYWMEQGAHWVSTPGALELVRECLGKK